MNYRNSEIKGYKLPGLFKKLKRTRIDEDYSYVVNDVVTNNSIKITEDIRINDYFLVYEVFFDKNSDFPMVHWIFEYKNETYMDGGFAEVQINIFNQKDLIYSHKREIFIQDDKKSESEYVYDGNEVIKGQIINMYTIGNGVERFDKKLLKLITEFISPEIDFIHRLIDDYIKIALKIKQMKISVYKQSSVISMSIRDTVNKNAEKFFNNILENGVSNIVINYPYY